MADLPIPELPELPECLPGCSRCLAYVEALVAILEGMQLSYQLTLEGLEEELADIQADTPLIPWADAAWVPSGRQAPA